MSTYPLPHGGLGNGAVAAMLVAYLTVMFVIDVALYIAFVIPIWKLYKKAGQKRPWLAFIPIAQYWPFFWVIKKSVWNILWLILPVIGLFFMRPGHMGGIVIATVLSLIVLILELIWAVRFFNAFGMTGLWLLLLLIPGFGVIGVLIVLYVMAFNEDYQYRL